LLAPSPAGAHLYYCGPPGFMRAVAAASAHWPKGSVHFEHFSVPPGSEPANDAAPGVSPIDTDSGIPVGFEVRIEVPNDKSILQVLRENGMELPSSCESGLCGTCRVHYLEGTPDHRDYILEDDEKEKYLLVCCSRAKGGTLVLDL
jgi:vanillate O-demethylase ferredoxin subunit